MTISKWLSNLHSTLSGAFIRKRAKTRRSGNSFRPRLEALEDRRLLASYIVDYTGGGNNPFADSTDSTIYGGTGTAGDPYQMASLRGAVLAANAAAGPDTIILPAGTYTLSIAGRNENAAATGDLDVTGSLSISGAGQSSTIIQAGPTAAAGVDRLFDVQPGATAAFDNLTMQHGNLAGTWLGGAIYAFDAGNVSLQSVTLQNNIGASHGGGITVDGSTASGNVTITDSTISDNVVSQRGGGMFVGGPRTLFLIRSTVSDNAVTAEHGGGISLSPSTAATIVGSTISGNSALGVGGGIQTFGGVNPLVIINSTISGNQSGNGGGGIYADADFTIINSTITGNIADSDNNDVNHIGGGLILGVRTQTLSNSIVAGNFRATTPNDIDSGGGVETINSANNNIIGAAATSAGIMDGVSGNIVGNAGSGVLDINSVLDTVLANNGGSTWTHKLVPASPASDAGNNSSLPADTMDLDADSDTSETLPVDQRGLGFARILNTTVDIGAFEADTVAPTVTIELDDSAMKSGETATVTFTFSEAPTGFDADDVTTPNGVLSNLAVTGNPLVYTATFTPNVNTEDASNTISVDTGYTDAAGNTGTAGTSANYAIDTRPPVAVSFTRLNPLTSPTSANTLVFQATFDEPVTDIDTADFAVNGTTTALVSAVTQVAGNIYNVTVSGGNLAAFGGAVGLNLNGAQNIKDQAGNNLPSDEPAIDQTYDVNNSDKRAPVVTKIEAPVKFVNLASIGGTFSILVTFNEPMDTNIAPNVSFPVENPSAVLALQGGEWISNVQYRADFSVANVALFMANVDVQVTGGQDLLGNVQTKEKRAKNLFTIDTIAPQAVSVTTKPPTVADANIGKSRLRITINFNESMDKSAVPTIAFPAENPSPTLTTPKLVWRGGTRLEVYFTVVDANQLLNDVDFRFEVRDAAGNLLTHDSIDLFDIDMQNPQVVSVVANPTTITQAHAGLDTFTLTVEFSEPMKSNKPILTFPVEDASRTVVFRSGVWTTPTTYVATYKIIDRNLILADVDVGIRSARDAFGNMMAPTTIADVFDVNM